jgi:uncharacterized protein YutE (UPF0331/DUF86 family)
MTLDRIQSKLDVIKANLQKLDDIPQSSLEEFRADFRNIDATIHLLQTSIKVLIDLGGFLVAAHALPTPKTSHEVMERLEAAGLVPNGTAQRFSPIVGFRNRVVHLYDRVDDERVFDILTKHREDLTQVLGLVLSELERLEQNP